MDKINNTLRMFSVRLEGPLDEKEATIGEGLYLLTSVVERIVAVGFLSWGMKE